MDIPHPVIDGHVDLVYAMQRNAPETPFAELATGPVTPQTLALGGVRLLVSALYCADVHNGPVTAAFHLRQLMAFADRQLSGLVPIRTTTELETCCRGEAAPGILPLLENGDALADGGLDVYEAWGLRVVGLTHAGTNRLADGNAVASPGGLRPAGRNLVAELARQGWAVDVAHLAEPGYWELLDLFSGPLLCSHTGLRRFCDRPRNLGDAQVSALLNRGGVLGLAFAPEMLVPAGNTDLEEVFRQLDWLVQRYGETGVALGSDLGGFEGECAGLEDHGHFGRLARRLVRAGYPEASVARIMGGNWQRFYGRLLAAAG
ncbi:MAG TPA: membrane dipeptidase [Desulfuromonadales bacterium]|jgi:membrane dipeptidase